MNTGKRIAPRWAVAGLAALLGLAGCAVGPDYQRPAMDLPGGYKESGFGGRDKSIWAHDQYTELKTIWIDAS